MIVVHHLENSRSQRVLWLLEELGVDYRIQRYARDPVTKLAPAALKKVHPLGKSPVITDGERTVAESGAIIEYLAERYGDGALLPAAGSDEALRCRYWMHYAEGTLMPLFVMSLIFGRVERAPWPVRPIAKAISAQVRKAYLGPNLQTNLEFVEQELARSSWFAGESLSIADIQMSFPMEAASLNGGTPRPRSQAYVERIRARPAYQRALEKGGPFDLLS
ncbi:glutathione S-transferase [Sinimarinibacterium sp. CAU 1509]|uniref:glutathione S-transferase family protein n=1 Tax=Sinimarinibacterium sp. CAU 1509 TaxID=2562283 RepID=UPI0010ACBA6D|nr:glutathione S-transferase [Sinimarinibacterium sp. CAU 1509]TJY62036.1 glutathione S-transferase [Sinimarinibacterium sp. CAU 1509]